MDFTASIKSFSIISMRGGEKPSQKMEDGSRGAPQSVTVGGPPWGPSIHQLGLVEVSLLCTVEVNTSRTSVEDSTSSPFSFLDGLKKNKEEENCFGDHPGKSNVSDTLQSECCQTH